MNFHQFSCRLDRIKKVLAAIFLLYITIFNFSLFAATIYDEYGNPVRVVNTPKGSLAEKNVTNDKKNEVQSVEAEDEGQKKTNPQKNKQEAEAGKSKQAIRSFDRKTIESSNSTSVSSFLRQKGFLVMSSGGAGSKQELSYKGFTAFCVKVYVDGIYANNPSTGEFDWNSIDLGSVESIEISESPKLGNTEFAGCIVYITTKKEETESGHISTHTAFSSYETKFFDSIYQSVQYTDWVDTTSDGKKNFKYDIFSSAAFYDNFYYTGKYGLVNNFNSAKNGNVCFNWVDVINENIFMTGSDYCSFNQLKAQNSGSTLTAGLERDYTTQNSVSLNLKYDTIESMTNLSYFFGEVDYLEKYNNIDYKKSDINKTNSQMVSLTENMTYQWLDAFLGYKETHSYSANADRHEISFGVGKKYDFGKEETAVFSIEPNVNFLVYGEKTSGQNMTSWHFEYLPSLTLGLSDFYLSGYRLVTLPTFNQLYWVETSYAKGNPNLKPETGWAASVGYRSKNFPLWASFTYSYYKDKIRWSSEIDSTGNNILVPVNTSNADFYAATLGYEQKVWENQEKEGYLLLEADFNVNEARLRQTYKQIMWVPEFQAHASVEFAYCGFAVLVDYAFTDKRYTSNDNVSSYPAIHLLTANLSYNVNKSFQIYARGENLLDQRVVYHDGYYIPSRKWTLGMKFKGSFYK